MIGNKSRSDILLEEKIAKVDDINFDKIYDVDEFAASQLTKFEDNAQQENIINIENFKSPEVKPLFELEIQPNEFLDNHIWEQEDEQKAIKPKLSIANKPLFYAAASIAVLLCILFIYNVFVINSLKNSVAKNSQALQQGASNITYVVDAKDNNYILFENSSKMEIENNTALKSEKTQTSNWFDNLCNYICQFFGG